MPPSRTQLKSGRDSTMRVHVNLSSSPGLDNKQQPVSLRDIIDRLDDIKLSKPVAVPRILLVGSTFEANRAVLSAISGIPFPTADRLRSSFPTELFLKHAEQTELHVTAQNHSVDGFSKTGFSKDSLPEIIDEVKGRMLGGARDKTASQILHIEISGPDLPDLALVDMPSLALFESEAEETAKELSEKYLRDNHNIILAIISAEDASTLATKILNQVQEFDPNSLRTLGVMIKIEKTDNSAPDSWALRTAQNRSPTGSLLLGWHILPTYPDRDSLGTNFNEEEVNSEQINHGHWSAIQPENRGVANLHTRLEHLLLQSIRHKIPSAISQIEQLVGQHKSRLTGLGDYRKYLNKIVSSYHKLAHEALQGNYTDPFFGRLYSDLSDSSYEDRRVKKFRALVKDLNRAFSQVMSTKGHRRHIICEYEDNHDQDGGDREEAPHTPNHLSPLVELYNIEEPDSVLIRDLERELQMIAPEHEGTNFTNSVRDTLALRLFRDQIQPWETIANCHIELVTHFAHRFVESLLLHATGCDTKAGNALVKDYVDPYFERKGVELKGKLDELLYHYHHGYDLQNLYGSQTELADGPRGRRGTGDGHTRLLSVRAHSEDPVSSGHGEIEGFGVSKTVENMQKYYDNALRVFIDNVAVLAVENCLIRDIPSILSLDTVSDITDKDLQKLSAESRDQLKDKLNKLEKALVACQGLHPRRSTLFARDLTLLRPPSVAPKTNLAKSSRASPSPAPSATASTPLGPVPAASDPTAEAPSTASVPIAKISPPGPSGDTTSAISDTTETDSKRPRTSAKMHTAAPTAPASKVASPVPSSQTFAADRKDGTHVASTTTGTGGGLFGGSMHQTGETIRATTTGTGGGLFGGAPSIYATAATTGTLSGDGRATGSLFGAAPIPVVAPPPGLSLFAAAGSTVPAPRPASSLFGSHLASTAAGTGTTSGGLFGNRSSAAPPTDSPATGTGTTSGGLFGNRNIVAPPPSSTSLYESSTISTANDTGGFSFRESPKPNLQKCGEASKCPGSIFRNKFGGVSLHVFDMYTDKEPNNSAMNNRYQNITVSLDEAGKWSSDEMRLADYENGFVKSMTFGS
ncbi:hypothetical protein QBC38DRAFT_488820 [Podospora fimiseda]|uniref:GED domain-containing protein n=1 Tax=Podospora fimiseda TaxID=252190 RepID=A0AAN7BG45_9PEZI|nr:hypothetical protein QBC38DRAFT_488820 [Podospora fimiseda]